MKRIINEMTTALIIVVSAIVILVSIIVMYVIYGG